MTKKRRPKRYNPKAERLTYICELENCPECGERLGSKGSAALSHKTVQTLNGEFYVVAYSRVCANDDCSKHGTHYHAGGHLKISLPYSTYGLDVIAFVGIQRDREHKQFTEIQGLLDKRGIKINASSVGRLYRLFLALIEGTWPQRRERLCAAAAKHGGLMLMADGLAPDGAGPQLYVLWEVFSGTPVSAVLIDKADAAHLTEWLNSCREQLDNLAVLALLSDKEKALVTALRTVWPDAPHQLCQMHFMKNLSEPIHQEDQAMRHTLREQLDSLPVVPDLKPEEAGARVEQLVPEQDKLGKENESINDTEKVTSEIKSETSQSHFKHLLFPETVATNMQKTVPILQHYYGYYRCAIRNALNRTSRKPFQCGGLQGYEQLSGINQHLNKLRSRHGMDPYLDQLQRRVQNALNAAASQAKGIEQARTFLTRVEHYLAEASQAQQQSNSLPTVLSTPRSETIQQKLKGMFSDLMQRPDVCSLSQRLNRKWCAMSKTWLPDILHCYDIPGLPRSNLDLESAFGKLRRAQRRTSGRKDTSPVRIFGSGEILLLSLDDKEILPLLQSVSKDEYWSQRRRQEEREEPRRWLTRLHQDPALALAQVDTQFYSVINSRSVALSNAPDDSC